MYLYIYACIIHIYVGNVYLCERWVCRAQPTSVSRQWSRPQVVPAQMWGWPALDVGESRCRCGRPEAQMWVRLGSTMNEPCVLSIHGDLSPRGCAMKHHWLYSCIRQRDIWCAVLCALRCGLRGVGSAGVWPSIGVQPEHRQLEHRVRVEHIWRTRPCAVARMRHATDVLLASVVPAQSGPGAKCGDGPPRMWASPGADVGDVRAQMWARLGSPVSESCVFCL